MRWRQYRAVAARASEAVFEMDAHRDLRDADAVN